MTPLLFAEDFATPVRQLQPNFDLNTCASQISTQSQLIEKSDQHIHTVQSPADGGTRMSRGNQQVPDSSNDDEARICTCQMHSLHHHPIIIFVIVASCAFHICVLSEFVAAIPCRNLLHHPILQWKACMLLLDMLPTLRAVKSLSSLPCQSRGSTTCLRFLQAEFLPRCILSCCTLDASRIDIDNALLVAIA